MVKIVDTRNCLATVDGIDQAQVPRRYNGILGQQLDRSLLPDTERDRCGHAALYPEIIV